MPGATWAASRLCATRRLDHLRQAQKETVGLNRGSKLVGYGKTRQDDKPTLFSQGIDKNLAHQARTLGALSDDKFEWDEIPVRVVDLAEVVRGEFAENSERKDFLPTEIDAIRRALAPLVATPHGGDRSSKVETFHLDPGKTRDKVGAFAGVSGRTVEKIAKVVEAAEAEPEKFGQRRVSRVCCVELPLHLASP